MLSNTLFNLKLLINKYLVYNVLINLNNKIKENNLEANFVANVHDEWQIEVAEGEAETLGKLGVESIKQAGLDFNLRCPLDGEYNVGENWSETH